MHYIPIPNTLQQLKYHWIEAYWKHHFVLSVYLCIKDSHLFSQLLLKFSPLKKNCKKL